MRHDLIGERCEAGKVAGTLVMWDSTETNLQGMILLDDGTLQLADYSTMRFQPRTEQPDELRAAVVEILRLVDASLASGGEYVSDETERLVAQLRKAVE